MKTEIDSFIESKFKEKPEIRLDIKKTGNKFELTLPTGKSIELPDFKSCEEIINFFKKKAQYGNRKFVLLDHDSGIKYTGYKIFTRYLEACHERIRFKASVRKHRIGNRKYYPAPPRKFDPKVLRPYERTW